VETVDEAKWKAAELKVGAVVTAAAALDTKRTAETTQFDELEGHGKLMVSGAQEQVLWAELYSAINQCLPREDLVEAEEAAAEQPDAARVMQRKELHIDSIEPQYVPDLAVWYAAAQTQEIYDPEQTTSPAPAPDEATGAEGTVTDGPSGGGWVIQISGYHYHNNQDARATEKGAYYVFEQLVKQLRRNEITLTNIEGEEETIPIGDLGIGYPMLLNPTTIIEVKVDDPNVGAESTGRSEGRMGMGAGMMEGVGGGRTPTGGGEKESEGLILRKFSFVIQLCWQPVTPAKRAEKKKADQEVQDLKKAENEV
ncbi:MAG: hypothetical protein HQ581_02085, partial [Planctomycetes bacterium]|nr:hypothetical protein [Planctomycetota bacterium]